MLSDFFTIELDTTAPTIEVSLPLYSGRENWNEIVIQSNEKLDEKQTFYFIDSLGEKREVTFLHDENRFLGRIRFNDFPNGIALLTAVVWDEVGNPSSVTENAINIIGNSMAGTVDLKFWNRIVLTGFAERSKEISVYNRTVEIGSETRSRTLQTRTRTGGIAIE